MQSNSFELDLKQEKVKRERQKESSTGNSHICQQNVSFLTIICVDRSNQAAQVHLMCSTVPEIHYPNLVIVDGSQLKKVH